LPDDLVLDSLQRRMRALHSLYYDAVATMDLDQVNHFEREGVVPIAFSLFHIVNMMDASFMLMTGVPPIWDESWEQKVRPPSPTTGSTGPWRRWCTNGSATTRRSRSTWRPCSRGPRSGGRAGSR